MVSRDSAGNPYIEIDNVRITMVDKTNKPYKDWAKSPKYLRFQAYKKGRNTLHKSLHMGAEFPVTEVKKILDFISSVSEVGGNF